jgi:hypothetical protein
MKPLLIAALPLLTLFVWVNLNLFSLGFNPHRQAVILPLKITALSGSGCINADQKIITTRIMP